MRVLKLHDSGMDRAETSPSGEQDGESDVLSLQTKKLGLGAWTLSATGISGYPGSGSQIDLPIYPLNIHVL